MKKMYVFSLTIALLTTGLCSAQSVSCPNKNAAQAVDYYLSNPYYVQCTALRDTLAHDENVKANTDGLIKLSDDGWSDFHWDGTSRVIFDNINLSKEGEYILTVKYRNAGTVDFIVNDESQVLTLSGNELQKTVTLNAGLNTIKFGKNDGWVGFYSLSLQKNTHFELPITVDCPDLVSATTPDYYLTHIYYALCTNVNAKIENGEPVKDNGAYVMVNADGNLLKLTTDGKRVDWHWDDAFGKSSLIFDNIYVSESGSYDILWHQQNGGMVDIMVNGNALSSCSATGNDIMTITGATLQAGEANTIRIVKNNNWPQTEGIMLRKHTTTKVDANVVTTQIRMGVYTLLGDFLGTDVDVKSLPHGIYVVDSKKVVK